MRKKIVGSILALALCMVFVGTANAGAIINEFHYDNDGGDIGEFIEVVLDGGTLPGDVTVTLYNGSGGALYNTLALTTFTSDGTFGGYDYYSLVLPANGLQNGAPDGIAIDVAGTLSEFLSYEGTFTATDGVANGVLSTDVGVSEPGSAPIGSALQRIDFGGTWCYSPATNTMGAVNDCGLPTGVCCDTVTTPNSCVDGVLEAECISPGAWTEDGTCETDCAWLGACCDPGDNWNCSITTQAACTSGTAYWVGGGTCEANCVAPTGSCCNETTYACDDDVTESECETIDPTRIWTQGGTCLSCAAPVSGLIINEVDADTPGNNDAAEFVELFDGGDGNTPLDGYVLVLFNGSSDLSYFALDLDTYSTDANGYFVIGSTGMAVADIELAPGTWGWLQNGADAVALYTGDDTDFPNDTTVTTTNLVDALVYDTNDGDDAELLVLLNASEPQINEDGGGNKDTESMQRCLNGTGGARNTSTYGTYAPTPDSENCTTPTGSCCDESTWTCWPDLTEDDCTTQHAGAVWTVGGDCADCVAPTGSCCHETTYACDDDVTESECETIDPNRVWTQGGDCATCIDTPDDIIINEIDADTDGLDLLEFIELYDGGVGNTPLSGLVVVCYNGSNDESYLAIDLDTFSTDASGYFLLGNVGVSPSPDIIFADGTLQNGADAVALYVGDDTDFPNGTAVTTAGLVDAVVYGTSDGDDAELLVLLNAGQPQVDEDGGGSGPADSIGRCPNGTGGQRNTDTYLANPPTPGDDNSCVFPEGACCVDTTCYGPETEVLCLARPGEPTWLGADTTCSPVNPCECSTIDFARTSIAIDDPVFLCGVTISSVISTTSSTSNKTIYLQDGDSGSPRGLIVYASNTDVDAILAVAGLGDSIDIHGYMGEHASLLQVVSPLTDPSSVGSPGVPAATVIDTADLVDGSTYAEDIESVRVKLECVQFIATGDFSGGVDYWVTDGTTEAKVRIPTSDIDLVGTAIPSGPVDITGFLAQYDWGTGAANYQVYLMASADLVASTVCTDPMGACCYEDGTCVITSDALCTGSGGVSWEGAGSTCEPINPCIAATGACCVDQVCVATNEESECAGLGGTWYIYEDCSTFTCPGPIDVVINEIRVDEPSTDNSEYFELKGAESTSLTGLTYIVIGDNSSGDSGSIEAVVDLTGQTIQADGLFLAAEDTFALTGIVDFTTNLDFENSDNVTHLLVQGFTGAIGQDLDTDNDCVLDVRPWAFLIDGVALIENDDTPPTYTECHYASEAGVEGVGPAGTYVPAHVYRCDGEGNPNWLIGEYDPAAAGAVDTPDAENPCSGTSDCATCPGDTNGDDFINILDLDSFVDAVLGTTPNACANMNPEVDELVNGEDIQPFVDALIASGMTPGTSCSALPGQIDIQVCSDSTPPLCPQFYCGYVEFSDFTAEEDPLPAGTPRCEYVSMEGICFPCTPELECHGVLGSELPEDMVIFRWVGGDAGNDCWITAKLVETCTDSLIDDCDMEHQFMEYTP